MQTNNQPPVANQPPPGQEGQPGMPSNQNSKTPLIILAIVGGLVLVGGLILVMFLFLGGDNDSSSDDSDTDDASESADDTDNKDDDTDDDTDGDTDGDTDDGTGGNTDGDNTSSNTDNPTQDTPPDNGVAVVPPTEVLPLPSTLPDLDLTQLSRISSIEGDAEEVATEISALVEEAGVAREEFINELAEIDIAESDVADFLQAYDLLTSESTLTSLSNFTETEAAVFEEKITAAAVDILASILKSCLGDLENADIDSLSTFDSTCILEPLNQFGRDVISILAEFNIS